MRRRWLLVSTIAVVIAIGTGMYTGLGGTSRWRTSSNDASYELLAAHDLKVELSTGSTVPAGTLSSLLEGTAHAGAVRDASERLVVATQIDASRAGRTVLVPGRIVGGPVGDEGVDRVHVFAGRTPRPDEPAVVLEKKFADQYELPDAGAIRVSGGTEVRYTGLGLSPEYFLVVNQAAGLLGHANFGVLFTSLDDAQRLAGEGDVVNELVVRLRPDADRSAVRRELAVAVAGIGGTVSDRDDDPVRRALYEDASNDQQVWDLFAIVILLGAGLASFNLVSRIVEAERREIGVGMALGVSPRSLAVRPILVGLQVALIGVVLGLGLGMLTAAGLRSIYVSMLPMPVWRTPLPVDRFAQGALLGIALPLVASALPVWRAVRVEPVDAIRSGAYAAASVRGGLAPLARRVRLPGRITRQLPIRNALRAPRRTILTALGVAGSIAALVVVLGALDSFLGTIDAADRELARQAPRRLSVDLDHPWPVGSEVVTAVARQPAVGEVDTDLVVSGSLRAHGVEFDVNPQLLDLETGMWTPTVRRRSGSLADGVLISEKAARDLGVVPGQRVTLRHPRRTGATSFRLVETTYPVVGLHELPLRTLVYLDRTHASTFGLEGWTNRLHVLPARGSSEPDVQRAVFGLPGVASSQPTLATSRFLRDQVDTYIGIFRLIELGTLLLAFLIATNSASISVDERAREEATMFAFGLPLRSVLATLSAESAVIGVLGTALGMGLGVITLRWMMQTLFPETMPDFALDTILRGSSQVLVVALGVGVVALAPLLMSRRLARMDVPSTLRVLE